MVSFVGAFVLPWSFRFPKLLFFMINITILKIRRGLRWSKMGFIGWLKCTQEGSKIVCYWHLSVFKNISYMMPNWCFKLGELINITYCLCYVYKIAQIKYLNKSSSILPRAWTLWPRSRICWSTFITSTLILTSETTLSRIIHTAFLITSALMTHHNIWNNKYSDSFTQLDQLQCSGHLLILHNKATADSRQAWLTLCIHISTVVNKN